MDDPSGALQALPLITSEALDDLAPEWEALAAAVPGAAPFHLPAWHRTWLRHHGAAAEPVYLSIRRDDRLIGVAALDLQPGGATDLGDPNVRDYGGPLALPGEEEAVAAGILEWLREDFTRAFEPWGIPADGPWPAAFRTAAERYGWSFAAEPEATCPGIDLPATFDEYVASLPKHDRHELRRKLRNFEAAGAAAFERITGSGVGEHLDLLFAMMRASRADKAAFLTPERESFFRALADAFAPAGQLALGLTTLDGRPVAATLTFELGPTIFLYNSGYDPAFARLAPGLVSKARALRDAIERGFARFDFLRGEEPYKRHLGGTDRQLLRLRLEDRAGR
ncbi:GNAT family N-acetyltransferase [Tepidiforma sp.]|uniref:GNAT family N-acetyltransferase n=1 Tax=Tepidiforma sp. TaxID=2682230 RepID=UPI002ADD4BC7|nr:GNAT family N-acetyltransferase [Tepidiforma sp.]